MLSVKAFTQQLINYLPLTQWITTYRRQTLADDLIAGIIVAILLIPQGMAYALLAGLPPQYGLYASILPLALYALLGSSRTLAVGPVAIASLMVNSALSEIALSGPDAYINAAINLSMLVGLILLGLRLLNLGTIVNFISHSVISGFTSAAALIIAITQLKHLLGVEFPREAYVSNTFIQLMRHVPEANDWTLLIGGFSLLILWLSKGPLCHFLQAIYTPSWLQEALCKSGPMFAVLFGSVFTFGLGESAGINKVGFIPEGLPYFSLGAINFSLWGSLFIPAFLIALIGYIESVSVGTALASRNRERIDPNKELIALGVANLGAAFSGTYPVAGGFGRSMVNFSAGAKTTIASLISALLVTIFLLFFTPLFYYLPKSTLAAIIIMAVLPLIDLGSFRQSWRFNQGDALTLLLTFTAVLVFGVEIGILSGILLSIAILLHRTSQPHIAIVGRVGGSEHFRNIDRHDVQTCKRILAIRIDESLYFANTRYVESFVLRHVSQQHEIKDVVLICAAINFIDANALETLENMAHYLQNEGVTLHLSEVKGPIMDQLNRVRFQEQLGGGQIFFTTDQAIRALETRD